MKRRKVAERKKEENKGTRSSLSRVKEGKRKVNKETSISSEERKTVKGQGTE